MAHSTNRRCSRATPPHARRDARAALTASPGPSRPGDALLTDRLGFAVFACYLVLAFTTAIPSHFTLPKLLGVHLYVVFAGVRWWQHGRRGAIRCAPPTLLVVTGALVLWSAVATANALHLHTALFGIHGRFNGLFTLVAGVALFVSTATHRLPDREIAARLAWLGIAVTAASIYAVLQAAGLDLIAWPQGRPASTMGNPVVLGGTLAMVLPFLAVFVAGKASCARRLGWTASTLVVVLALVATLARGPWIGAVLGVGTLLALSLADRHAAGRLLLGATIGLLLIAAATASVHEPVRARLLPRLASFGSPQADQSVSVRLLSYRAAAAMLLDHPVTGIGFQNFPLLYPRYRLPESEVIAPDVIPTMVHSQPLEIAVAGGLPLLLLFAALAWGVVASVGHRRQLEADAQQRLLGAGFLGAFVALGVEGLAGWPDVAFSTLAWIVAGLAVAWSLGRNDELGARPSRRVTITLTAGMCIMGGALAHDTWMRILADRLVLVARDADPKRSWPSIERLLRDAVRISPDKAWACDAAAGVHVRRVVSAADRQAYEQGIVLARQAWADNSFDPYMRLRRVELEVAAVHRELVSGVGDEARRALVAARALDPNNATVHEWEARLELAAGRTAEAAAAIETALQLRPGSARYRAIEEDITRARGRQR